jgi:lipopolysaccharide assembly protein A
MRILYCFILLVIMAALAVFAVQNNEHVTLHYLDRQVSCSMSLLIGLVYLLGMVSGWTVVGVLKRTLQRVTERRAD